jgi:hypothetical protein
MTSSAYLVVAGLVAALTAALHFIVLREPPGETLPTARFVPPGSAIVRSLARTPTDRVLLALRVLAVLLIGAAFARPRVPQSRAPSLAIVAVDRSNAVGREQEAIDSASRWLESVGRRPPDDATAPATAVIAFDSTAVAITGRAALDTLNHLHRSSARGSITAALVAAFRTAGEWRDRADSVELTIVSPVRGDEIDAALPPLRALWPGAIRLVRTSAEPAAEQSGERPTIDWPVDGHAAHTMPRAVPDTIGGLAVGELVTVRPFVRRWQPETASGRVIGWWIDGSAAIVERDSGTGCVRDVAVAIDTTDAKTRHPEVARIIRALRAPCRSAVGIEMKTAPVGLWETRGGSVRVAASALAPPASSSKRVSIWLLVLALIALLVETVLRVRTKHPGSR